MKTLPNNQRLLLAAWRFQTKPNDPHRRLDLFDAVKLKVEGRLYEQLRDACQRGLNAKPGEMHLVTEGIGELMRAIGEELPPRPPAGAARNQLWLFQNA